jgi:hypothetical protein
MDTASEAALPLGIPSDPTQLVPLNARAVAESKMDTASEAALALGIPSDPTQLVPVGTGDLAGDQASVAASAARHNALAVYNGEALDAAQLAYAARLEALADCYAPCNLVCSVK